MASYTDRVLPVFYRLTAFWAGQPGSMLFWALAVGLSGSAFALTRAYRNLSRPMRLWYWSFFYIIMGFLPLSSQAGAIPLCCNRLFRQMATA